MTGVVDLYRQGTSADRFECQALRRYPLLIAGTGKRAPMGHHQPWLRSSCL